MQTYTYTRTARNGMDFIIVMGFLVLLAVLYVTVNMHPIFVALGVMVCIPALFEFAKNTKYQLVIDQSAMWWTIGRESQSVSINNIEVVTVTTRLDFSSRVTLRMKDGDKIRLHPGVTPKGSLMIEQLEGRNIPFKRQHFTFVS